MEASRKKIDDAIRALEAVIAAINQGNVTVDKCYVYVDGTNEGAPWALQTGETPPSDNRWDVQTG